MQDERLGPPLEAKERLLNGEWLWQPDLIRQVREKIGDRPVVVLDLDGVLRGAEDRTRLFPEAETLIEYLKSTGVFLMVWTSSTQESLVETFGLQELLEKVELIVTRKNYQIPGAHTGRVDVESKEYATWSAAVVGASWMPHAIRVKIQETRGKNIKLPSVLAQKVMLIEDGTLQQRVFDYVDTEHLWEVFYKTDSGSFAQLNVETWFGSSDDNPNRRRLTVELVKKHLEKLGWVKGE